MDTIDGSQLVVGDGRYWRHQGKYMGQLIGYQLIGRPYDPDAEFRFEYGTVSGLGLKFTEILPHPTDIIIEISTTK
jgi:hypothetical protein